MFRPTILRKDSGERKPWSCKSYKYHFLQVLVAIGAGLSSLAPGMSMGFSAVALPQLRPLDNPNVSPASTGAPEALNATAKDTVRLTLAHEDAAWFMTVTMASTPAGCLLSGYLTDKWGRKGALLAVAFPGILGWMLVALVPTIALPTSGVFLQMLVGRALSGIAIGMASSPACILAGETSAPSIRGSVLCLNSLSICAGILLVYFLGEVLPGWRTVAAFGAVLSGFVAIVTLSLPESPVWLRSRGRFGDADWVCSQLGLRTIDSGSGSRNKDGSKIRKREAGKNGSIEIFQDLQRIFRLLRDPRSLRPLTLLLGLFAFQQASGVFVVTFNAVEIAASSGLRGPSAINGSVTAIFIGMCTFVVATIVCLFIDRWGRRMALMVSGLGMAVCMFALAAYVQFAIPKTDPQLYIRYHPLLATNHSYVQDRRLLYPTDVLPLEDPPWHTYVPLASLLCWAGFAALGFVPIPWALPAELLPAETRGIGSGILSAMAYAFGFAALMTFSSVVVTFTLPLCLSLMALFAVGGTIYVALLLPETRGVAIDGLQEKGGKWLEVYAPLYKTVEEDPSDLNP